jgi:hypothetical protein
MNKFFTSTCAAVLVMSTAGAAITPALAAPMNTDGAQFIQVAQYGQRGPVFYQRGGYGYYNGHRGDRHQHAGWRQYNGYWFPPSAFIGAAIGGAILGGIIAHAH